VIWKLNQKSIRFKAKINFYIFKNISVVTQIFEVARPQQRTKHNSEKFDVFRPCIIV